MYIRYLLCIVFAALHTVTPAQQTPMFNGYFYQPNLYNPARAGSDGMSHVLMRYRQQWVGIDDKPVSQLFSYQGAPFNPNLGIGITAINDQAHLVGATQLLLAMAYHTGEVDDAHRFSVGINLGMQAHRLRLGDELVIGDPNDPLVLGNNVNQTVLDAGIGLHYRYQSDAVGFQVDVASQQLPSALEVSDGLMFLLKSHVLARAALRINAGGVGIEPGVMLRGLAGDRVLGGGALEYGVRALFAEDQFWAGVGARTDGGGLQASVGAHVKSLSLAAAIERHSYLGTTVELGLGVDFGSVASKPTREPFWNSKQQLDAKLREVRPRPDLSTVATVQEGKEVRLTYRYNDDEDDYLIEGYPELENIIAHIAAQVTSALDAQERPHLTAVESITLTCDLLEDKQEVKESAFIGYAGEYGERLIATYAIDGQTVAESIRQGRITKEQLAYLKLYSLRRELMRMLDLPESRFAIVLKTESASSYLRENSVEIVLR